MVAIGRLEQFHQVPGRVMKQHLPDGNPGDDARPEPGTPAAQFRDRGVQVGDPQRDPVPAARRGHAPVGQHLTAAGLAGHAQQQAQIAAVEHREHR